MEPLEPVSLILNIYGLFQTLRLSPSQSDVDLHHISPHQTLNEVVKLKVMELHSHRC